MIYLEFARDSNYVSVGEAKTLTLGIVSFFFISIFPILSWMFGLAAISSFYLAYLVHVKLKLLDRKAEQELIKEELRRTNKVDKDKDINEVFLFLLNKF